MSKRVTYLLLAVCLLTMGRGAIATDKPQNVILFGWDGAQREHVEEALARGELPTLEELKKEWVYVKIDIEGKTDTKAGWSQILTGYYPEVTGVYSNSRFQPVPEGLSIFERLETHFGREDFVTVAVIGKKNHCGAIDPPKKIRLDEEEKETKAAVKKKRQANKPDPGVRRQQGKIVEENGVKYRVVPGQPYHNMYKVMEVWEYGLSLDEKVGTRTLELLEKYKDKPFFFFVHFAEVDHSGHKHGENSEEYNNALISNDKWTGRIINKVKELGLADKTQFYITADHGFNEGAKNHRFAPYVFLATNNKKVNRDGRRQDVAPTILEAFGLNLSKIEPKLDGISFTKPDNRPPAKIVPPKARRQNKNKAKQQEESSREPDVIFVPTPQDVVDKMLELAQVTKDDLVYDLGCGDGRIVVTAAKQYGCKAVGYDIDPERIKESLENVKASEVEDLANIERKDIFTLDLSKANVVTLYLLPTLNVKLIPQLEKLAPGSRIVSHDFDMRGVEPDKVIKMVSSEDDAEHEIYLWTCPLKRKASQ